MIVALTPTVTSFLFIPDMHTRRKSFGIVDGLYLPTVHVHLSLVILMKVHVTKKKKEKMRQLTDNRNCIQLYIYIHVKNQISLYILSHIIFFSFLHSDQLYAKLYVSIHSTIKYI